MFVGEWFRIRHWMIVARQVPCESHFVGFGREKYTGLYGRRIYTMLQVIASYLIPRLQFVLLG